MTFVAESGPASLARSPASRWHVAVADTAADVGDVWQALEAAGGASVYQTRKFLEPWIKTRAAGQRIRPQLGVVSDVRGQPVALLPFGIARRGPLHVATFLGGRDSNLNLPLIHPSAALSTQDARDILGAYCAAATPRIDLLVLSNQPRAWRGRTNPFALPGSRPSPSNAYAASIAEGADAFLAAHTSGTARKKLRLKAAHLAALGPLAYERADPSEAASLIETFVQQKQARLARGGIAAGVDEPAVRAFLVDLAAPASGAPVLDLYVLRVAGETAALYGGLPNASHWHGLINSYDPTPARARCSPGELLLRYTIADLARRGFASFDLGIGEARYKNALCEETIRLVDTVIPITVAGRLFAAGEELRLAAKGAVKRRPWALELARGFQRWTHTP